MTGGVVWAVVALAAVCIGVVAGVVRRRHRRGVAWARAEAHVLHAMRHNPNHLRVIHIFPAPEYKSYTEVVDEQMQDWAEHDGDGT